MQPARDQQALHNADMFGAQLGPAEQPALLSHRGDPQGALKMVRIDRYVRVIQVNRQAGAALPDISQRAQEGAARQVSLRVERLVDPGEKALNDGFRLLLAAYELGLPIQPIVTDLLLDLVESSDRIQWLFGLRRLDIHGIKDLATRVCLAVHVRDPRILRVMLIGAIAISGAVNPTPGLANLEAGYGSECMPIL